MSQLPNPIFNPRSLYDVLLVTANRLESDTDYRWTHIGSCNCGHLAQTVTLHSAQTLHELALQKAGDWAEQVREYCPTSGYPLDHIIQTLLQLGISQTELRDLERLANPKILNYIPKEKRRHLSFRKKSDVIIYLRAWAKKVQKDGLVKVKVHS